METKDNDLWRNLFEAMPDEALPTDFHARVIDRINKKAVLRKKVNRFWEICGVASGIATMLITGVIVFYKMDISFKLPEIEPYRWPVPAFDFEMFTSPSFGISIQIGILALLLLILDSTIRRAIEKKKHK